jgi:N-acyl-D-aspartate/D-glutamate deacylase
VNDLPGGGQRLSQTAVGFAATIVGGQVTIKAGEPTAARPGQLVRMRAGKGKGS